MKITEIIKKFDFEIVEKDGKEGLKTYKKATPKQLMEIKSKKQEIIAELKRQKEKESEQRKIQYEKNKQAYLKTADLRRCLVRYADEWMNTDWYIETLNFVDEGEHMRAYQADFRLSNHVGLKYATEKLKAYHEKQGTMYGFGGTAWEITPEEETELIADQVPAAKEAEEKARIEAEAKAKADAEKKQKQDEENQKREALRATIKCEILKQGKTQGEELDPYALVRMTNPETSESLQFNCRNIFDFGYVINPDYAIAEGLGKGGLAIEGKWQDFRTGEGWHDVRELTEFEKRCMEYLRIFPPIATGIRM